MVVLFLFSSLNEVMEERSSAMKGEVDSRQRNRDITSSGGEVLQWFQQNELKGGWSADIPLAYEVATSNIHSRGSYREWMVPSG